MNNFFVSKSINIFIILASIKHIRKCTRLMFNKYIITVLFLVDWLLFLIKMIFFTQRDLSVQLKKLYEVKRYYLNEIKKIKLQQMN